MQRALLWMFTSMGLTLAACSSTDANSTEQLLTGQGCQVNAPDPRACDPTDTKKTTVCHIPPGNPANAHTICVGNPSVDAHLDHGDILGTCACPGTDDAGVGGGDDDDDHDAGSGSGSGSGSNDG